MKEGGYTVAGIGPIKILAETLTPHEALWAPTPLRKKIVNAALANSISSGTDGNGCELRFV